MTLLSVPTVHVPSTTMIGISHLATLRTFSLPPAGLLPGWSGRPARHAGRHVPSYRDALSNAMELPASIMKKPAYEVLACYLRSISTPLDTWFTCFAAEQEALLGPWGSEEHWWVAVLQALAAWLHAVGRLA
jgi:hypothetical protein